MRTSPLTPITPLTYGAKGVKNVVYTIEIQEAEDPTLVGSVWETDGITAKCILPALSIYVPGIIIPYENLGNFSSVRLSTLLD
jgi:hypothetical protein